MSPDRTAVSRILTVVFGAAPMLVWLPFLAIWTLSWAAMLGATLPDAYVVDIALALLCIVLGVLGLWGAYSLWAAAIGPLPVAHSTAYGLGGGIGAMIFSNAALIYSNGGAHVQGLDAFLSWVIVGPILVAASHIYWRLRA